VTNPKCPDCGKRLVKIPGTDGEYICNDDNCPANIREQKLGRAGHVEYYGTQKEINKQKYVKDSKNGESKMELKFIVLTLFFISTVIIILFIAMLLHELGHYIVASRSSENVSVTYDLSLTSWGAWCEWGGNMNETDIILSRFSGGLLSGGLLGLLWLLVFGFERGLHHMNLNFALVFVSIKEIAIGIIEGVTTIFGIYEWYRVITYIFIIILFIVLIHKYAGKLAQWTSSIKLKGEKI